MTFFSECLLCVLRDNTTRCHLSGFQPETPVFYLRLTALNFDPFFFFLRNGTDDTYAYIHRFFSGFEKKFPAAESNLITFFSEKAKK